jgi:hypothetical protein
MGDEDEAELNNVRKNEEKKEIILLCKNFGKWKIKITKILHFNKVRVTSRKWNSTICRIKLISQIKIKLAYA